MLEFIKHVLELIGAHLVADLIILSVGAWIVVKLWMPAKEYWRIRKWFRRAVAVGVTGFYPSRESYSVDRPLAFSDYIKSAEKSFQYFGHWLAFTIEQHYMLDTLCEMANAGKSVQLILLDPEIPPELLATYARYLGETEASLRGKLRDAWLQVHAARETLSATGRKCLELRSHQEFIPYSAFWFDRDRDGAHILIDMKLFGASRKDAYGIELEYAEQASSRYPSLFSRYATSLSRLQDRSTVVG